MRVLVVEDDPALRLGLSRLLLAQGFQVDAVADGHAALAAAFEQDYQAAVLDLGLPGADGFTVLADWRRQGKDLAVLVLTAAD